MVYTRSVNQTLRPLSSRFKREVLKAFRTKYGSLGPLNDEKRKFLEDAIFAVENELEHRSHDHPQVAIMRAVRNCLLDDLPASSGGNECTETRKGAKYSQHDAVKAILLPRKKLSGKQKPPPSPFKKKI